MQKSLVRLKRPGFEKGSLGDILFGKKNSVGHVVEKEIRFTDVFFGTVCELYTSYRRQVGV